MDSEKYLIILFGIILLFLFYALCLIFDSNINMYTINPALRICQVVSDGYIKNAHYNYTTIGDRTYYVITCENVFNNTMKNLTFYYSLQVRT